MSHAVTLGGVITLIAITTLAVRITLVVITLIPLTLIARTRIVLVVRSFSLPVHLILRVTLIVPLALVVFTTPIVLIIQCSHHSPCNRRSCPTSFLVIWHPLTATVSLSSSHYHLLAVVSCLSSSDCHPLTVNPVTVILSLSSSHCHPLTFIPSLHSMRRVLHLTQQEARIIRPLSCSTPVVITTHCTPPLSLSRHPC